MSLVVCQDCTARYAPDLPQCPQCSSTRSVAEHSGRLPLLPFLDVACATQGCRAVGAVRRVYLRAAAPGVVEWPSLICATCGGHMRVQQSWMDQTTTESETENEMAKITVHGGPSDANAEPEPEQADTRDADTGELPAEPPVDTPLPEAVDGDSTEREAPTAYDTWMVEQLRAELAGRDLPTTGKKAELVKRLTDADTPAAED